MAQKFAFMKIKALNAYGDIVEIDDRSVEMEDSEKISAKLNELADQGWEPWGDPQPSKYDGLPATIFHLKKATAS